MFLKACSIVTLLIVATASMEVGIKPRKYVITIESATDLNNRLTQAGSKLVVVGFLTSSCPYCKAIAPKMEELAKELDASVIFVMVDANKLKAISEEYGVKYVPTFAFVKNLEKLYEYSGSDYDELKKTVAKYQ